MDHISYKTKSVNRENAQKEWVLIDAETQILGRLASQVAAMIDDDDDHVVNVDLKTSTLKPIHAEWLITTHSKMEGRADLITAGFRKAGLI